MSSLVNYIWSKPVIKHAIDVNDVSIAVAESITAGALANTLCSEPGASNYFKGCIVTYSDDSNKKILNIDPSPDGNFANAVTTAEMAKKVASMFNSRFGISTTGYSLPINREENKELNISSLVVEKPYAYICLYDSLTKIENIYRVSYEYKQNDDKKIQRANVQAQVALYAHKIYLNYVASLKK